MKYTSDKIIKAENVSEYFSEVLDTIYLKEEQKHKIIRYIFKDGSSVDVEYTISLNKIIDKTKGNSPIRQPY